jgi:hypothetical protein
MNAIRKDDEPEIVWVSIPLDLPTYAWLARIAEECHAFPEAIAASILRDVCEDDQVAHAAAPAIEGARLH